MLDSLEKLKAELIKQKSAIISKGGKVVCAHSNPSPSEITAAINTIEHADLSKSTATPEDVKQGKTFYSQDQTLKVGTHTDIDYGDVTATPEDVKINKTFYDKEGNFATGSHLDPELNKATATAEDVKIGKTFFAGDIEIKTGTHTDPDYSSATATDNDVACGMTYFAGDDKLKTGSYVKPVLDNADAVEMDVAFGKTFYAGDNLIKTGKYVKPDFSGTATEQDVVIGKTFYGADNVKRTGTHLDPDFTLADATEQDVVAGKTFFSGDSKLKTGTHVDTDFTISTATEEDVVKGKTFYSKDNTLKTGTHTETDFTLADATEQDVVAGKKFFSQNDQIKTGTHVDTDFTLANASESDVVAGKTFYAQDDTLKTGRYVAPDFSSTTATVEDVAQGKQFFDSTGKLVTGNSLGDTDMLYAFINPALREVPKKPIYFTYPSTAKSTGKHAFSNIQVPLFVTLGPKIENVDHYSFDSAEEFPITITDYPNLPKLRGVYYAGFRNTKNVFLDELPPNIYGIENYGFYNCCKNSTKIKIPSTFFNALNYAFASDSRYELEEFDLSESTMTDMGDYLLNYLSFRKPILINEGVKIIGVGFNYNGDSPYVEVPTTCKDVYDVAFSGFSSQSLDLTQRKYVYFKGETPPKFQTSYTFHNNYLKTDFKIYVPDQSVEAYKAISNLSKWVDRIHPISQLAE